jgi:outer membrane biogenesis lipoprotein LolB
MAWRQVALVLIPAALLLAGCANQQSLDPQQKEDKAAAAEAAKETGAIDDARCQSYGFQPGSPRYAQCRMDIDGERKQADVKE